MSSAIRFSANLGFLWKDLHLLAAVGEAADAGFDAIEMHQPYEVPAADLGQALRDRGLEAISLNTGVGDTDRGEFGLAALPGREVDARYLLDQAIEYAGEIGCRFVSVVVGRTEAGADAERTLCKNLAYGADRAAEVGVGLLLEPLNTTMASDLHLVHIADAVETIETVGAANVQVMADTFHVLTMERSLEPVDRYLDHVGHVQISGWPDRAEPDHGIDFESWLPGLVAGGYRGVFGAEYTPRSTEADGLSWFHEWNAGETGGLRTERSGTERSGTEGDMQ